MRTEDQVAQNWTYIYWAPLLLLAFGIVGCCDARPAASAVQCRANLRTLYAALVEYVSLYGDVPRGNDGKASLAPLEDPKTQEELGIGSSILRCPADKNPLGSSYLLNPALSVRDLRPDSMTVVAVDRSPNHPGSPDSTRTVLIGNGARVEMWLPLKEQEDWLRLFLSGDKRACRVSMDGDIRWYVGEERGYVPEVE